MQGLLVFKQENSGRSALSPWEDRGRNPGFDDHAAQLQSPPNIKLAQQSDLIEDFSAATSGLLAALK